VGSDSSLVIERANGHRQQCLSRRRSGGGRFRPSPCILRVSGAGLRSRLEWNLHSYSITARRRLLSGAVVGLLAAAAAFASGAAVLSGTLLSRWRRCFLTAVLLTEATGAATFDNSLLVRWTGSPCALRCPSCGGARLCRPSCGSHRALRGRSQKAGRLAGHGRASSARSGTCGPRRCALAGLVVRGLAVAAAITTAGYLVYCGRKGNAGARRLAPAATIFALVAIAASCPCARAFGLEPDRIGCDWGFAASGLFSIAIATAVPLDPHALRTREPQEEGSHTVIPSPLQTLRADAK